MYGPGFSWKALTNAGSKLRVLFCGALLVSCPGRSPELAGKKKTWTSADSNYLAGLYHKIDSLEGHNLREALKLVDTVTRFLMFKGDSMYAFDETYILRARVYNRTNYPLIAFNLLATYAGDIKNFVNSQWHVWFYVELGNSYYKLNLFTSAIQSYLHALRLADAYSRSVILNNLGMTLNKLKKYPLSTRCFFESYRIRMDSLKSEGLAVHSLQYIANNEVEQNQLR